jgi:hypothetical protein
MDEMGLKLPPTHVDIAAILVSAQLVNQTLRLHAAS